VCNRGLGALVSTTFASEGCNIAVNYFNRLEPAQKVQKECEAHGVRAVLIQAVCSFPLFLFPVTILSRMDGILLTD
jgi:hypothetical protein